MLVPKRRRAGSDTFLEHRAEIMTEARELGLSGATDFEAAEVLGINQMTLDRWKRRHPEFREALQLSKDIADGKVVASLYHKARGYTFRSEKIFNNEGIITRAETIEHVPPDTTAAIFWLKNRQRDQWRDEKQVNVDGEINVNHSGDLRELALAMVATIQAGMAAPMIEGEVVRTEEDNAETDGS